VVVGGDVGTALAAKWQVSVPAIEIATGLILRLVAIRLVMSAYEPPQAPAQPLPPEPMRATLRLTFPLVVTPYGIAALIAVLASTGDPSMITGIYLVLIFVMVLNLLAMLFIREVMRGPMLLILQVAGAVLGVLQVGLAVQIIIHALRDLHVLRARYARASRSAPAPPENDAPAGQHRQSIRLRVHCSGGRPRAQSLMPGP